MVHQSTLDTAATTLQLLLSLYVINVTAVGEGRCHGDGGRSVQWVPIEACVWPRAFSRSALP